MALKEVAAKRFLDDILGSVYREGHWKVLILDHLSTRIISACCNMVDVMSKAITLVEALEKKRQPLTHLEAIYILIPNDKSVGQLIADFEKEPLYKAAHVFFLEKCPASLFSKLSSSKASKKIHTLQEANLAFLPYESKVFTLDYQDGFHRFYSESSMGKVELVDRIADQLATVCAMLGEYPSVRYRDEIPVVMDIATALQGRLDSYRFGPAGAKKTSELIILDRGFDTTSPILHELTYQAMVCDLLKLDGDIYSYYATTHSGERKEKKIVLGENDETWNKLRHQHIADVSKFVYDDFQSFAKNRKLKPTGSSEVSIKDLARYIRKVPQYQKELNEFSLHINLVDDCMRKYKGGVNSLCKVEQDLATGLTAAGDPIPDAMKTIMPSLFDRNILVQDKIRLLMLYSINRGGMTKDEFDKLMQHSEIPHGDTKTILNLMHLGVKVLNDGKVKGPKHKLKRKVRYEEQYEVSRWVPVLQDILEYIASGDLSTSYCPYLKGKGSSSSTASASAYPSTQGATSSVRQRWNWIPQKDAAKDSATGSVGAKAKKDLPTIIVFIVGGMTFSEMRTIYEFVTASGTHDAIIGSTHILTPKLFLEQLKELRSFS